MIKNNDFQLVDNSSALNASTKLTDERSFQSSLASSQLASAAPAIHPLSKLNDLTIKDIAISDLDGDGFFGPGDIPPGYIVPTNSQVAQAIAQSIASNPAVKVAFMGETHSETADRRFFDIARDVKAALEGSGRDSIAVIETPTSPALDSLIDKYEKNQISKTEFLDKGSKLLNDMYMDAYNNHGVPLRQAKDRPAPLDINYWRNRLEAEVVKLHEAGIRVAYLDTYRFQFGLNRDEGMANRILDISKKNPNSVIIAQIGCLHSQKTPSIDFLPDFDINDKTPPNSWYYHGAVMSKGDEKLPTATRIAQELGGKAVLSIAVDDAWRYRNKVYFQDWYGVIETVEKSKGKFVEFKSFDYFLPGWDPQTDTDPNIPSSRRQDPLTPPS